MQRRTTLLLAGLGLGVVLFAAATFGFTHGGSNRDGATAATDVVVAPGAADSIRTAGGASLDDLIANLQTRLQNTPKDHIAWATLGIAYVQQAKVTVNPDYYPKAEGALQQSLDLGIDDNYLVYAGLSALASARHDFARAKDFAERGLAINSYNALLYGALSDAEVQLGEYDAAFAAVQKMVDLSPDAASLSRASYTWELRGDIPKATALMQRALDDASTASNRAFANVFLGELAFNAGDPDTALRFAIDALAASPDDPAALAGRAKAEAALGQYETALDHYAAVIDRAPEPTYLIEYGELLQFLGRDDEARVQYDLFGTVQQLFSANGVEPDAGPTLFIANHGDPTQALADAEAGIRTRPFIVMHDAYAWALHRNGRDTEALVEVGKAMQLGTPNALFHFHAGMINYSLGDLTAARDELASALSINPFFNILDAPVAQQTLDEINAQLEPASVKVSS
jgi:tetratricopeptide (TPR) repeat protein